MSFESIQKDLQHKMEQSISTLKKNLSKIRTGRANPSLLDDIKAEIYGSPTQLSQVATISVEDSRTLSLSVWDKSNIPAVEKAIQKADLGLNPSTSGTVIRIILPAMTEETRMLYVKQVKQEAELIRIAIRNIRTEINKKIKSIGKQDNWSEDQQHQHTDTVQKVTDEFIGKVESLAKVKEKELMSI